MTERDVRFHSTRGVALAGVLRLPETAGPDEPVGAVRLRIDPARAGALRARLFASGVVREEHTAADGTLEMVAALPDAQRLELARTTGVEVLELAPPAQTCAPGDGYLQSGALRAS